MQIRKNQKYFKKIILISIILSFVFFVIGIYMGVRIFNFIYSREILKKIEYVYSQTKILSEELRANKEIVILDLFDEETKCRILKATIDKIRDYSFNVVAKNLPYRLEEYETYYRINEEYLNLKKEYMRLLSDSYFLTLKYKKECEERDLPTLVYFYSSDCGILCIEQGRELDKLRLYYKDTVYFFIFDKNLEIGEVKLLRDIYEVDYLPTIIINEKHKLSGFVNISTISFYLQEG